MITITIKTNDGFIFWNDKPTKSSTLKQLKKKVYNELIRTNAQVKDIIVQCKEDGKTFDFNFDDDEWICNGVNYKDLHDSLNIPTTDIELTPLEQYERSVKVVNNKRKKLYKSLTDPLINESIIKRLQGRDEEATILEQEALSLRETIQTNNPLPEKLEGGV